MLHYTDDNRGEFQNEGYAKQLVSFSGMKYEGRYGVENVTPTDIDGYIQLDKNNIFIFFELKKVGSPPYGQGHAYEKMIDGLKDGGKNAVLLVAEHDENGQIIIAKDTVVKSIYCDRQWYQIENGASLDEMIRRYIRFINKQEENNPHLQLLIRSYESQY